MIYFLAAEKRLRQGWKIMADKKTINPQTGRYISMKDWNSLFSEEMLRNGKLLYMKNAVRQFSDTETSAHAEVIDGTKVYSVNITGAPGSYSILFPAIAGQKDTGESGITNQANIITHVNMKQQFYITGKRNMDRGYLKNPIMSSMRENIRKNLSEKKIS